MGWLLLFAFFLPLNTAAADIEMGWHDLRWGDFQIGQLNLRTDSSVERWQLQLADMKSPAIHFEQVKLDCIKGQWALSMSIHCEQGNWQLMVADKTFTGQFQIANDGQLSQFQTDSISATWRAGQSVDVLFEQLSLSGIEQFWSERPDWPQVSDGVLTGQVSINLSAFSSESNTLTAKKPLMDIDLTVNSLGFDNASGDLAGVGVSMNVSGNIDSKTLVETFQGQRQSWPFDLQYQWTAGEMLFGVHYLPTPAAAVLINLDGYVAAGDTGIFDSSVSQSTLLSLNINAKDTEALDLAAQVRWVEPRLGLETLALKIDKLDANIPGLQRRYLSGALARVSLGSLETNGDLSLTGNYGMHWDDMSSSGEAEESFKLRLKNIDLVDDQNRFVVNGLNGELNWYEQWQERAIESTDWNSSLSWEGLQIYRLPFAPTQLEFILGADNFTFQPDSKLGFLDGGLVLHELAVEDLLGDAPSVQMDAELLPVALTDLTRMMNWPSFGGTLAGRIPGIDLNDGIWTLDGQLALDIFGGQVVMSGLSAERPFGVLPTFNTSIWIERVQLEPLTEAFEIGRITGPVDGQINDLRLLDWQPVQFDAWLRTSDNPDQKRRISQRAVDTISSIGGGVGAGLQSTFLRLFEDFGYKQLGFSCRLLNGVCQLDGIGEASNGDGFLLVQGSGVPALNVVGHNRRVAWRRMLDQLKAATKSSGPSIN